MRLFDKRVVGIDFTVQICFVELKELQESHSNAGSVILPEDMKEGKINNEENMKPLMNCGVIQNQDQKCNFGHQQF